MNTMESVKRFIRDGGFAWPGGYQSALIMSDGEVLCAKCAKENFRKIAQAHKWNDRLSPWKPEDVSILWEGDAEYCVHCNCAIDTAYGPVTEKE